MECFTFLDGSQLWQLVDPIDTLADETDWFELATQLSEHEQELWEQRLQLTQDVRDERAHVGNHSSSSGARNLYY